MFKNLTGSSDLFQSSDYKLNSYDRQKEAHESGEHPYSSHSQDIADDLVEAEHEITYEAGGEYGQEK